MPDLTGQSGDSVQVLQAIRRVPVEWVAPKALETASPARLCRRDTEPALRLRGDGRKIGKLPSRRLSRCRGGPPYPQAIALYRTYFGLATLPPRCRHRRSANCA